MTAGNSSPLTDGASAVMLMAEEKAKALGHEPLAYIRSYAVAAVDPGWQLLMGPVYAVPKALERAGLPWSELGLVEIHEAFAAQVLSNVQAWGSQAWADRLGLPRHRWVRSTGSGPTSRVGLSRSVIPSPPPVHGWSPRWRTRCAAATSSSDFSRSVPRAGWGMRWCWRGDEA